MTVSGSVGLQRKRTSRLMFCAAAANKNCSRTNFNLRRRKRRSPIRFFSSANRASTTYFSDEHYGEPGEVCAKGSLSKFRKTGKWMLIPAGTAFD